MNEPETRYHNFVSAATPDPVTIEPAQTSLMRRQDVMQAVGGVIDAYQVQQGALLDQVQGQTHGGFLSGADQVRERRKTSRMYLLTYGAVAAMTTGGLAYMATLAGMDGALSIAGWLFATGALTLALAWRRHGDEFAHSPEGIARHVIDAHWDVAIYESETRRLSLRWEHDAEARRQAAQEKAAEYARQLAQLRIDELDARRKAIEAQRQGGHQVSNGAILAQESLPSQLQSIEAAANDPTDATAGDGWQAALLQWVAALYTTPGNVSDAGVIRCMVPWSARSTWLEADKIKAKEILCSYRPALVVHDGNRWRLRTELVSTADEALQVVAQRL